MLGMRGIVQKPPSIRSTGRRFRLKLSGCCLLSSQGCMHILTTQDKIPLKNTVLKAKNSGTKKWAKGLDHSGNREGICTPDPFCLPWRYMDKVALRAHDESVARREENERWLILSRSNTTTCPRHTRCG